MTHHPPHNRGFIRYIALFIVVAAILAYFGITAVDIVESTPAQFALEIWNQYGAPATRWIWDTIIIGFIWKYAVVFFEQYF